MKKADLKVLAIVVSIALFITLMTSNAVSVVSIMMLTKNGTTATGTSGGTSGGTVNTGTNGGGTATVDTSTVDTSNTAGTTAAPGAVTPGGTSGGNTSGGGASGGKTSSTGKTYAQILALYTTVMNKAKTSKPAYHKYEYQELPTAGRTIRSGETLLNTLLGLAGNFMTTKDKATSSPENNAKGSDMKWFPVYTQAKGCYLTDTSKIKSASYNESNGQATIVITLQSETNPAPLENGQGSNFTGKMFAPIKRSDVDATLNKPPVSSVVKNVQYTLLYHDCTATLVYNVKTNQIVSLQHIMHVTITGSGRALLQNFDITTELIDTMKCYSFAY